MAYKHILHNLDCECGYKMFVLDREKSGEVKPWQLDCQTTDNPRADDRDQYCRVYRIGSGRERLGTQVRRYAGQSIEGVLSE
jgi:hypothetical protein